MCYKQKCKVVSINLAHPVEPILTARRYASVIWNWGKWKRNTSNWSNFCMLLRRVGLTVSAGLSCYFSHCCSAHAKRTLFMTKSARTSMHFIMRTHFTFF